MHKITHIHFVFFNQNCKSMFKFSSITTLYLQFWPFPLPNRMLREFYLI